MTIVLPRDSTTVDDLVGGLTFEQWREWTDNLDSAGAQLYLPKFRLENNLTLNATLKTLGMGIAFTDFADFSRMSRSLRVQITDVLHRTFVNVNEEGTEAAAATAVGIGYTCACEPPPIQIDRPFVFALRENLSGTILFMGVIRDPRGN